MTELVEGVERSNTNKLEKDLGDNNTVESFPLINISSEKNIDIDSLNVNTENNLSINEKSNSDIDEVGNVIECSSNSNKNNDDKMEPEKSNKEKLDDDSDREINKTSLIKKKSKLIRLRIDSDSDEDNFDDPKTNNSAVLTDLNTASNENLITSTDLSVTSKIEADKFDISREFDESNNSEITVKAKKSSNYTRLKSIVNSDSDDESKTKKISKNDNIKKSSVPAWKSLIDSNSDSDDDGDDDDDVIFKSRKNQDKTDDAMKEVVSFKSNNLSEKLAGLVDPESDYESMSPSKNDSSGENRKKGRAKKERKKTGSQRAAMKEAMREIKSESQRLIREKSLSIPYHRPKQRTLQEILKRRPIAEILPHGLSTSALIKNSVADISKALEKKEKEAELLYESSDSENEKVSETKDDEKLKDKSPVILDITKSCEKNNQDEISRKRIDAVSKQLFTNNDKNSDEFSSLTYSSMEEIQSDKYLQEFFYNKNSSSTISNDINVQKSDSTNSVSKSNDNLKSSTTVKSQEAESKSTKTVTLISENTSNISSTLNLDDENVDSNKVDSHVLGLPPPCSDSDEDKTEPEKVPLTNIKKQKFLNLPKIIPKLSGGPGIEIDLTTVKPNKKAINELMNRFFSKHTAAPKLNVNSEVSVLQTEITSEGFKILKDVLPYKISTKEAIEDPELSKPGAKFQRLREELRKKICDKRDEEWKKKEKQAAFVNNEELVVEEEEVELLEDEFSAEESEPEENDVLIVDKKKKTHIFNDEEAEVSDDGELELSIDEEEGEEEEDNKQENAIDENDGDEEAEADDDDDDDDTQNSTKKQKKFSRIVIDDDSGDEDVVKEKVNEKKSETNEVGKKSTNSLEIDDSSICKTPLINHKRSSPLICSPFFTNSQINDILNSTQTPTKLESQSNENQHLIDHRKKLFNISEPSVTDDELLEICSGKFTNLDHPQSVPKSSVIFSNISDNAVTDSQISTSINHIASSESISQSNLNTNIDDDSQSIKLSVDIDDESQNIKLNTDDVETVSENKGLESKISNQINKIILDFASSSEDEEKIIKANDKKKKILKKKKPVKLVFSDDEDDKSDKDEYDDDEEEVEEKFVDYDSDENEVVVIPSKDIKKVAAKFVENEAELSGSEEGSADENEEDLDKLEMEEGDMENIDEDQVRNQLGKIHAMHLLDKDKREVKDLQELLFDDELYDGNERERKFKWKNINKFDSDSLKPTDNDDVNNDDDFIDNTEFMNELDWRKYRLEREKFLKNKAESSDSLENDMASNQLLKYTMKNLQKRKLVINNKTIGNEETVSNISIITTTATTSTTIVRDKFQKTNVIKKGSFLARKEEELSRVALMLKQTNDNSNKSRTKAQNFVFSMISPTITNSEEKNEEDEASEKTKKQQDEENIERNIRKRKIPSGDTPKISKISKFDINQRGKKLF